MLTADDADLSELLRHDRRVRDALRWSPTTPGLDQARTLVAAARVERNRRRSSEAVENIARLICRPVAS